MLNYILFERLAILYIIIFGIDSHHISLTMCNDMVLYGVFFEKFIYFSFFIVHKISEKTYYVKDKCENKNIS